MAGYQETPIDRAQTCASQLHAIDELLAQSADGSDNMHLVNPDHFAILLNSILRELDDSLLALSKQVGSTPHLRSV